MTKYFMKGTEDEVNFGDKIILNLKKEGEHMHYECKFTPLMVPLLLEEEIIEEREVEEEENEEKSCACGDLFDLIESVVNQMKDFELRLQKLEQDSAKIKRAVFAKKK